MRRAVVPLAIVLALVSGVVLAETRRVVLMPAVALDGDPRSHASTELIRRFYAAVNELLATGDDASLDGVVDAGLVAHSSRPGVTPDRAGFVRALRALRATAPALRLTVLDVLAQGDRVAARVGIEGGDGATFLGHPVAAERLWGAVDVFRVEAGRVVEYWSDAAGSAMLEPLLTVAVPIAEPTRQVVTLERWTYAPNASETRETAWGSLVVLVDAGTLTVVVESGGAGWVPRGRVGTAGGDRPVARGTSTTLGPGDALVVPHVTRFTARNDGAVQAVALVVSSSTPAPQWRPTGAELQRRPTGTGLVTKATGGVAQMLLAGGMTVVLPAGGVTIALGRAALAPGAALPPRRVDVAELAAVEAGQLAVTADGGAAWVTSELGAGSRLGAAGTVAAGSGVHLDPGSAAGYRAEGKNSLTLLLVSIQVDSTGSVAMMS